MKGNYFPSNLKYLRTRRGLEQSELASLLGRKSPSSISEWEAGRYTPKVGTLSDIARIFNVDISDLMNKDLTGSKVDIVPISNNNPIPLVGTIAAGMPILAEENIEDYFYLDSRIKADFALRIKGDSMIDAGIYQDDIVFIKQQSNVENGEIAAVLIDDEATLKKFYKEDGTIILQAENDNYKPRIITEGNISILGKLVAVLNIR